MGLDAAPAHAVHKGCLCHLQNPALLSFKLETANLHNDKGKGKIELMPYNV